jgi:hypothetical protein
MQAPPLHQSRDSFNLCHTELLISNILTYEIQNSSIAGMAYERQISPTSIDELSSLPSLNCNAALGFVGLAGTDMAPDEHNNTHNNQGKHS